MSDQDYSTKWKPVPTLDEDGSNIISVSMTTFENEKTSTQISTSEEADDKDVEIEIGILEDLEFEDNCFSRGVTVVQNSLKSFHRQHRVKIAVIIKVILLLLYTAYFAYCMYYRFGDEGSVRLAVCTCLGALYLLRRGTAGVLKTPSCLKTFTRVWGGNKRALIFRTWTRRSLYVLFTAAVAVYIGVEIVKTNPRNVQSLVGVAMFVIFGFIFSTNPARVNWHPVFWGIGVQFIFAIIILRTVWGFEAFNWLGDRVEGFLAYGNAGAMFVFGKNYRDHRIAFAVLPIMLFFNAIIFLLYHLGVIQVIIRTLGTMLAFCLDTGPIESIVAAANVFIGLTEAPLLVRPFLAGVTPSELHAIMTCGFASVSGGVLGTYVQFGVPAIHLLSASVMSAPAALAITKLMCPETHKSMYVNGVHMELGLQKHKNALSAISSGAVSAVKIAANTIANQIAFVAVLEFANVTVQWLGERAGLHDMSFELICSYLFFPIAYGMGVAEQDCGKMGALLGKKIFGTPIMSYIDLGTMRENRLQLLDYVSQYNETWHWSAGNILLESTNTTLVGGILDERSEVIGTYALCGFSTITSIGVTLGTLVPMAPERKADVVRLVIRALIAGNIASFLTGSIAGLLFNGSSV